MLNTTMGYDRKYRKVRGIGEFAKRENEEQGRWCEPKISDNVRVANKRERQECADKGNIPSEDRSNYSQVRYKFFLEAPFEISNQCCNIMKKNPAHNYHKQTGRNPITAQMASESRLRTQKWLQNGCNAFNTTIPTSNPMSFWTEQDILLYIKLHNLPICSVYGDVVIDYDKADIIEGQMDISDFLDDGKELFDKDNLPLKTTGCSRTGCCLCGFGCHLEKKGEGRFELLKETHPGIYGLLDVCKNNGVTMREAIEWTNKHLDSKHQIRL